jgi:hypothetical protein
VSYAPFTRRSGVSERFAEAGVQLLEAGYSLGDLIEVRKGEEVAQGRLVERTLVNNRTYETSTLLGLADGLTLRAYLRKGYAPSLIARALPKDPGFYVFGETGLAILDEYGQWYDAQKRGVPIDDPASFFGTRVPRRLKEVSE